MITKNEFKIRLPESIILAVHQENPNEVDLVVNGDFFKKTGIEQKYLKTVGVTSWEHEGKTLYGEKNIDNTETAINKAKEDLFTKLQHAFELALIYAELATKNVFFKTKGDAERFAKDPKEVKKAGTWFGWLVPGSKIKTEMLEELKNNAFTLPNKILPKTAGLLALVSIAIAGLSQTNFVNNFQPNNVEPTPAPTTQVTTKQTVTKKASPTTTRAFLF